MKNKVQLFGIPDKFKPIIDKYEQSVEMLLEQQEVTIVTLTSIALAAVVESDVSELTGADVALAIINMTDLAAAIMAATQPLPNDVPKTPRDVN